MSMFRLTIFLASSTDGRGNTDEVDVSQLAVGLVQVLQALADGRGVEPISVLHRRTAPRSALVLLTALLPVKVMAPSR